MQDVHLFCSSQLDREEVSFGVSAAVSDILTALLQILVNTLFYAKRGCRTKQNIYRI